MNHKKLLEKVYRMLLRGTDPDDANATMVAILRLIDRVHNQRAQLRKLNQTVLMQKGVIASLQQRNTDLVNRLLEREAA